MAEEGKEPPHYLCHGELNQHHILMGGKEAAIIEFNRMHLASRRQICTILSER